MRKSVDQSSYKELTKEELKKINLLERAQVEFEMLKDPLTDVASKELQS